MQVVFEGVDPQTKAFSLTAPTARRVGGRLEPRGADRLALRLILDHSLLEVFCGTGQVITTRVYRGAPPTPRDLGIDFLSLGGATEVSQMQAWEVACIWDKPQVRCRLCTAVCAFIVLPPSSPSPQGGCCLCAAEPGGGR